MTVPNNNDNDDRNIRILIKDILSTPVDFGAIANRCALCDKKGSIGEISADKWKPMHTEDFGHILLCPKCYEGLEQYFHSLTKEQIEDIARKSFEFLYKSKIEQAALRDDFPGEFARSYLASKNENKKDQEK
jgi:hypothetical protein